MGPTGLACKGADGCPCFQETFTASTVLAQCYANSLEWGTVTWDRRHNGKVDMNTLYFEVGRLKVEDHFTPWLD